MPTFARPILLLTVLLLTVPPPAHAQWTRTAAPVLHEHLGVAGALGYQSGLLWAGYDELWVSTDVGFNWTRRADAATIGSAAFTSYISAIRFLDKDTGYIATVGSASSGVLKTTNGGLSWRRLVAGQIQGLDCDATGKTILAGTKNGLLYRSTDRGENWSTYTEPGYTFFTQVSISGNQAIAMVGFLPTAVILTSADLGATWQASNTIDGDTWSFAQDRCEPTKIWAANEDVVARNDRRSEIYSTTDLGLTWTNKTPAIPAITGAITSGPHAITAGLAYKAGLLQSSDKGATWSQIAGPHTTVDTRSLLSLDDTVFIVADSEGYIWRGMLGFAPNVAVLQPSKLFDQDSLGECGTSVIRGLALTLPTCTDLGGIRIVGRDTANYAIVGRTADSVYIEYYGSSIGASSAKLVVSLLDGALLSSDLGGYRMAPTSATAVSANASAYAIGETIEVPLHLEATSNVKQASWVLHYDTSVFVYKGAYFADGRRIDPGPVANTGRIAIDASFGDTTVLDAIARFQCFPTAEDTQLYAISIDSIHWRTSKNCPGSIADVATAIVQANGSCVTPVLSKYLRYGASPTFSVAPNPATKEVQVDVEGLSDYTISIVDLAGTELLSRHIDRSGVQRLSIDILPQGNYIITASSATWRSSRLIEKK